MSEQLTIIGCGNLNHSIVFELSPVVQQAGDRVFQDLVQLIANN